MRMDFHTGVTANLEFVREISSNSAPTPYPLEKQNLIFAHDNRRRADGISISPKGGARALLPLRDRGRKQPVARQNAIAIYAAKLREVLRGDTGNRNRSIG